MSLWLILIDKSQFFSYIDSHRSCLVGILVRLISREKSAHIHTMSRTVRTPRSSNKSPLSLHLFPLGFFLHYQLKQHALKYNPCILKLTLKPSNLCVCIVVQTYITPYLLYVFKVILYVQYIELHPYMYTLIDGKCKNCGSRMALCNFNCVGVHRSQS